MTFSHYIDNDVNLGETFRLRRATVVGPYPTRDFIDELLTHKPDEVVLAVDDGWPQERLDDIQCSFRDNNATLVLRRVAPALGNGLVHAKLYLLEWINAGNDRRRHTLLAGSANASSPGFSLHAESFVHVDLANIETDDKKKVLDYFAQLRINEHVDYTYFYVGRNSWLSMPALRMVHTTWPNGFDSWIRRGRLCHSYQPDPQFGRLVLRLKEPMPQDLLGVNLGSSGFSVAGETQAFVRPYLNGIGDSENAEKKQTWRQRYFTETVYGFWTSAECFKQLEEEFVAADADRRKLILDTLRNPSQAQRAIWIDDFLTSIGDVFNRLPPEEQETYFHVQSTGVLNQKLYRDQAEKKIDRDVAKAFDQYFCSRFTSGFAFPPVPPLDAEFDNFVLELCANLLAKLQPGRVHNWLAGTLRENRIAGSTMLPEELFALLRNEWEEHHFSLINFHKQLPQIQKTKLSRT